MLTRIPVLARYFIVASALLTGCNGSSTQNKQSVNGTSSSTANTPAAVVSRETESTKNVDATKPSSGDHEMIYKVGQYPSKPNWMTQKQWESYIDWESKHIHQQEAPMRNVEARIRKVLSNVLGRNQIREVTAVQGSGAARSIEGLIAMVDVYSDQSRDHAQERAATAYVLVLNAGLTINRVIVTVYLRQEHKGLMDHALYSLQADRGERPMILQEFTPLR